jgi:hypothetical protein
MKWIKYSFAFAALLLVTSSPAQAAEGSNPDTSGEDVLCPPGVYVNTVSDCLPSGPSQYLTELAQQGITLPIEPIPVNRPDFELTYVDRRYGQVRASAPVYGSAEQARAGKDKEAIEWITSPFSYISYEQDLVVEGERLYQIRHNAWMTAYDVIRISPPTFQGQAIQRTPSRPFGWILSYLSQNSTVETKRTPGYAQDDYSGHLLDNHELVWIFDKRQVDEMTWYLVGPDEWVPQNVIAGVFPDTTPPNGVPGGRWIEVNLFEQTLAVYDNYELVFATLIASGLDPFWTRPGLFQIYEKLESTPMRGAFEADRSDAYYLEDVPWTMYFDQARALHGAYWRANLGFPQSHGCVNLSIGDARWIFDWAQVGDWVYVWDPSGKTPTDPSLYTEGGA